MGYTTDFRGVLDFDKPLTAEQVEVINDFNEERHDQNVEIEYPGIWCQWRSSDDGKYLEWDQGEKFYNYVEWLQFLIDNYFEKWGVQLNGQINWYGEDNGDLGQIHVTNSKITVKEGKVVYE